jgi:RimJ/RimL family protein N-acetyltransferase
MDITDIVVEHAVPERDAGELARLINLCVENQWTVLNEFTEETERAYLEAMGSREAVFVAYVEGEFAGFSGLAPKVGYSDLLLHCAERGTWVLPKYWGSGVSKALWLRGNFPFGRKVGFHHYSHFVPVHNTRAIRHYEKLGFRVCGCRRRYVEWPDGSLEDAVLMELSLER